MFGFFTFIAPILTNLGGVPDGGVGYVLLAAGIGLTGKNYLGARLTEWRAGPSLVAVLIGVATVRLIFAALGGTPWSATAIVTMWGVLAFAVCAITQAIVVEAASSAPNLASRLNISAFNLGNAIGAGMSAAPSRPG